MFPSLGRNASPEERVYEQHQGRNQAGSRSSLSQILSTLHKERLEGRSWQYEHRQILEHMQPTPAWKEEHSFETESKRSFGPKLLSLGDHPYTQSTTSIKNRRNFDIYSVKSLL